MDDQPDGSAIMTFDTNKAFDDSYKKEKGRKRVSQKGIGDYILELFQKGLDKEDGHDLRTLKKLKLKMKDKLVKKTLKMTCVW